MALSPADVRADYPEFANTTDFPDPGLVYWLNAASLLLNPQRWPQTQGNGVLATGALVFSGQPAPGDIVTLAGSAITFVAASPVGLQVLIGANTAATLAALLNFLVVNPTDDEALEFFEYAAAGLSLLLTSEFVGTEGNALTLASTSANITPSGATLSGGVNGRSLYEIGTELLVCHHLVLERQAGKSARRGAPPGVSRGAISAEGAGGANVNYDSASALLKDAGHYNLTTYGTRYLSLLRLVGAGPIQVGFGSTPPNVGPAWPGPGGGWLIGQSW